MRLYQAILVNNKNDGEDHLHRFIVAKDILEAARSLGSFIYDEDYDVEELKFVGKVGVNLILPTTEDKPNASL